MEIPELIPYIEYDLHNYVEAFGFDVADCSDIDSVIKESVT